jgi:hypothetical protein
VFDIPVHERVYTCTRTCACVCVWVYPSAFITCTHRYNLLSKLYKLSSRVYNVILFHARDRLPFLNFTAVVSSCSLPLHLTRDRGSIGRLRHRPPRAIFLITAVIIIVCTNITSHHKIYIHARYYYVYAV